MPKQPLTPLCRRCKKAHSTRASPRRFCQGCENGFNRARQMLQDMGYLITPLKQATKQ